MRPLIAAVFALLLASPLLANPDAWRREWPDTDFSRSAVDFNEVLSGGPPKDGIPAIDNPRFRKATAERRLSPREPVLTLELGGEARAYPIRYLMWHEIVNDTVAGVPVAVTFCPLCNTGMVFDRRAGGKTLSFGVSGLLRHSDMIMYDRETQSWWQQALGQGIVGRHMGTQLVQLPAWMESWAEFSARHPQGLVMDQPKSGRSYGANPYAGYDSLSQPFLYMGEDPPHGIPPLARVVRVGNRAWPLSRLAKAGTITEAGVTISWTSGQASALDSARLADGRDVGSIRVRDAKGRDIAHDIPFAFAFHAFHPNGKWMLGN